MTKRIQRLIPALALLALAACADPVGPTDPVAASIGEGQEQEDQATEDRSQTRGGEALAGN